MPQTNTHTHTHTRSSTLAHTHTHTHTGRYSASQCNSKAFCHFKCRRRRAALWLLFEWIFWLFFILFFRARLCFPLMPLLQVLRRALKPQRAAAELAQLPRLALLQFFAYADCDFPFSLFLSLLSAIYTFFICSHFNINSSLVQSYL